MQMAKRCEGQKDVNGKKLPLFKTRQNEKKGGGGGHPFQKTEKSDRTQDL